MNSTVSVAIATFRAKEFLRDQLVSIWQQTRPAMEIVIYDDASPDDTNAYIEGLQRESPIPMRIFRSQRNRGSSATFIAAIQACQGDWIALADQDDVWLPQKLETLVSTAESKHYDAIFSDAELVSANLTHLHQRLWSNSRFSRAMQRAFVRDQFATLLRYNVVTGATLLFNARFKQAIGSEIPIGWIHDYWIALVIAAQGMLGFSEQALILYRQHGNNQIGQKTNLIGEFASAQHKLGVAYRDEATAFAQLERHLQLTDARLHPSVGAALAAKQDFLNSRYLMRQRFCARSVYWFRNVLSGRYFRYGQGWRPLLKDLLLP